MPVLVADNLRRSYGTRLVLDDVSIAIDDGERVGLVGSNGSGKSTLGRILAGFEEPDEGRLALRKGARISVFEQEPKLDPGTAYETLTATTEAPAHEVEAMLSRLGITDPSRRVDEMSGGERRRVALARTLISAADLLILDEPTNHLDIHTIEWLEKYLRGPKIGACLIITHDRFFLDEVVQRTAEIADGKLYTFQGGYEAYLTAKAERAAHEARADRNRQNILRRELEWLRRGPKARTTKQKARIDRAESLQSIAGPTEERSVEMHVQTTRAGGTVLETKKLTAGYEGAPPLVQDLTLVLTKGERVGIVGRNGAGKTTLLQTLLGKRPPLSGTVKIGKRTKTTYLDQSRQGLDPEKTVAENVAGDRTHVRLGDQDVDVRGYLGRFLFDYEQMRQPVGSLSGGEQTRTLLAKLLLEPANLLILDEPTNDLDTSTLAALEEQLVGMDATALIVTHDRTFLDRIATSILAFEEDGRVTKYAGNYSDYKERLRANAAEKSAKKTLSKESRKNSPKGSSAAPKKLTYGERLELEAIEPKIEAAEAAVAAIETELADPDLYKNNAADVPAKTAALESARTNLQSLMNRWEYLETKNTNP